jgi:hypothetical protein
MKPWLKFQIIIIIIIIIIIKRENNIINLSSNSVNGHLASLSIERSRKKMRNSIWSIVWLV